MPSVTRRPKTGPSAQKEATESRVFRAVEELLAQGNRYTELGVQQIADRAGIGRSTFYVHFTDKSDLLIRLTSASTAELFAAADVWVTSDPVDSYLKLELGMAEVCRQRRRHQNTMNALAEVAGYDRVVGDFWREQMEAFSNRFAKKIASEQQRGRARPGLDARGTAFFLTWAVERSLEQRMQLGRPEDDAELVKAISAVIWVAIYGDADSLPD